MKSRETPFADRYREMVKLWNYDDSYAVMSLPVWDLNNFRCWLNESLEIMNVNHTCTYKKIRAAYKIHARRGVKSWDPSPMQVRVAQWSDQWTQSKQFYVHFYEFHSNKPLTAR
jgi:hypothetical protein